MADFFISYTSADKSWAEWIAFVLEEEAFSVSIQAWDFRPGSNFVLEMQKAASKSDRTVMVLSPDYIKSVFAAPEWASALAADPEGWNRKLVPVMVRRCQPSGLLAQVVYIDLVDLDDVTARDRLMTGVKNKRAKPQTRPPFPGAAATPARGAFPGPQASARPQPYRPKIGQKPTDADKRRFLKETFATIKEHFEGGLAELKGSHANVECDFQLLTAVEFTAEVFVSGNSVCRCHIWQGGFSGDDGISYYEGRGRSNHNTTHELLSLRDSDGELRLSSMNGMLLGRAGPNDPNNLSTEQAADHLWRRFVAPLERNR